MTDDIAQAGASVQEKVDTATADVKAEVTQAQGFIAEIEAKLSTIEHAAVADIQAVIAKLKAIL